MPPQIALLLCIFFILCLFILDFKGKSNVSSALWVPLIWMLIIGSRFVSQWLNPAGPLESPEVGDLLEGSPLDRNIFLVLIIAGLFILSRRKISWPQILNCNVWIFLLFLYGGISIVWSDFPFVSFKRWIKSIGILVMVLVVFSESDPVNAVKTVLRRCAYVLVPLSVVFIKYYPDLGRSYSRWTGEAYYHGVATTKNGLGFLCLFSGIYFFWDLLAMWRKRNTHFDKQKVFIHIVFLIMVLWLLRMADSATSTMCFITGVFILVWTELPIMKRNVKAIGGLVLFYALVFLILILLSDVEVLVSSMGRDMTLTGRLDLWNQLIDIEINPLVGTGYESFWLGARAEEFWARYWWRPNQSHNGYLETYLNLGWIGTLLLVVVIISAYQKSTRTFLLDYDYGKFRLTFLVMVLFYNVTEAAFHGVHLMRFFFILVAMDFPRLGQLRIQGSIQERRSPEIQSIEV